MWITIWCSFLRGPWHVLLSLYNITTASPGKSCKAFECRKAQCTLPDSKLYPSPHKSIFWNTKQRNVNLLHIMPPTQTQHKNLWWSRHSYTWCNPPHSLTFLWYSCVGSCGKAKKKHWRGAQKCVCIEGSLILLFSDKSSFKFSETKCSERLILEVQQGDEQCCIQNLPDLSCLIKFSTECVVQCQFRGGDSVLIDSASAFSSPRLCSAQGLNLE